MLNFLCTDSCPATPVDRSGDFSETEKLLFKHHDKAYGWLVMNVQCLTCFGLINTARSPIHPKGSCHLAWKAQKGKFEPKLVPTMQQLKAGLNSKSMSRNKDPDAYIQELERVRQRLEDVGTSISDRDLINKILYTLPKEYENTAELIQSKLDSNKQSSSTNWQRD